MAFLSIAEIIDLVIMTLALGYIFLAFMPRQQRTVLDVVKPNTGFDLESFKLAIYVTAPAVILHELAHKFVAIAFGAAAVFKASYFGLALGIFLRIISAPFIIFVPGFVQLTPLPPLFTATTAFAGPFMNLALFFIAKIILNKARKLTRNQAIILHMTLKINLFLFLFNMIPIPPFDGSKVFAGLIQTIF